jgi:hypothetical protein
MKVIHFILNCSCHYFCRSIENITPSGYVTTQLNHVQFGTLELVLLSEAFCQLFSTMKIIEYYLRSCALLYIIGQKVSENIMRQPAWHLHASRPYHSFLNCVDFTLSTSTRYTHVLNIIALSLPTDRSLMSYFCDKDLRIKRNIEQYKSS